jgi:hypothetical protein
MRTAKNGRAQSPGNQRFELCLDFSQVTAHKWCKKPAKISKQEDLYDFEAPIRPVLQRRGFETNRFVFR